MFTLRIISLVQRKQLMADEVVPRRKRGGDSACPDEFVDDGVAGPFACVLGAGDEARVVNLDCKELGLEGEEGM